MKKTVMLLCVAAICFLFIGIQNSYAGLKEARPDPAVEPAAAPKIGLPDLTVSSVRFARVIPYTRDGIQCYALRPGYTITNIGHSDANNFDCKLYEFTGVTWKHLAGDQNLSLKPGQSITIDQDSAAIQQLWCTDLTWQPGWRVVVDENNTVAESNENNNMAEKMFEIRMIDKPDIPKPTQPMIKPDIPKATQKEIQPAPMPKRPPVKAQ
jgi:hypothetical protein